MADETWHNYKEEKHSKPSPLKGIRVLEVCTLLLGPAGPGFLAEMGAEVIKCEFPPMGDTCRDLTPFGYLFREQGISFVHMNTNKYWLGLDLHVSKAQDVFRELAAKADVIENNLRQGVMESWNIGYEDLKKLNPRLIFASITAYGQFGPMSRNPMPGYDNIAQARSGVQSATGEVMPEGKSYDDCPWAVPTKAGPWIAWAQPGTFMAVGILAALNWRKISGQGQALDVATAEAYARFDDYAALWYQETGIICERFGSLDTAGWLYCFAPTKDGAVFLGGLRLEMWQAFADMLGKWDEWNAASWTTLQVFMRKDEQLKWAPKVFAETRKYTNDELVAMSIEYSQKGRLAPITTVVAPVCSPQEAMKDANWLERGMFTPVKDPVYGEVVVCQAQHKMTKTPIRTKWVCQPVGYENEAIYKEYMGFSPARLNELKKTGII
jgi:crotonobetainyl-CoA:carnitine CoA-transferase CaiB-like acyl-CoA transferase